jgi:ferrous-iron efflux pump FieF
MNREVLHQQEKSIFITMVLALLWCLPNLVLAMLSGSLLLLNEVPDNLRFIFTNFLSWRILRSIRKGRLQGFDYGTDKLETFGGFVCSIVYILTVLFVGVFAIKRLIAPVPLDNTFTLVGALCQLAVMLVMGGFWFRNRSLSQKQYSPIMEAQWRGNRADTLGSLVIFAGLTLSFLLKRFSWGLYVDPGLTLVFVFYSIASLLSALVRNVNDMLDKTLQEDLQLKIDQSLATHYDGYEGFHGVRSRRAGGRVFIEVALSFSADQQVRQVSETVDAMCKSIANDIPGSEVRVVLIPSPL